MAARSTGIYASSASRRQRMWRRRRRALKRLPLGLFAAWAPVPVLAVLVAERYVA